MPDRLGSVTVSLRRGDITLSWETRDALMARLKDIKTTARIRAAFTAVGVSRPVKLNRGQKAALLSALEEWSLGSGGYDGIPKGLVELRNALIDDLHDRERQATP
jgi:hypothetical protein